MADKTRRDFVLLATSAIAVAGAGFALWPFIASMNPSADVVGEQLKYVNVSTIAAGKALKVAWGKKGLPVYIRHLTEEERKIAWSVAMGDLIDPQTAAKRVKPGRESWGVVVGICTRLDCIVTSGEGDYNGWMCNCCGAQYDALGRVRHGPAKKNLDLPPFRFTSDNEIVIGES